MSTDRPPRRPGWVRIALFFALGVAAAWQGEYVLAGLFAVVGCVVWFLDRKMARRPPEG